jgi:hypothetical protein
MIGVKPQRLASSGASGAGKLQRFAVQTVWHAASPLSRVGRSVSAQLSPVLNRSATTQLSFRLRLCLSSLSVEAFAARRAAQECRQWSADSVLRDCG